MIKPIRMPRWEDLNAYVDGALAPARALEIERAAAAEPRVAAEIGRLKAMKASLQDSLADTPPPLPALPRRANVPRWAAAAAALLVAVALAFYLLPAGDPEADWLQRAEAEHREWLAMPADAGMPAILPAAVDAAAFDLTLAGLTLVEVRDEADGRFLGWVGSKGCRLGLWLTDSPEDLEVKLTRRDGDGLLRATWQSAGTAFALMAGDMDPRRFASVARLLETRTRPAGPEIAGNESLTLPCLT